MKIPVSFPHLGFFGIVTAFALFGAVSSSAAPDIWLGEEALTGADPWQVALVIKGAEDEGVWCGGSIIDEYTVVTAAHCLKDYSGSYYGKDLWIVEGTTDLTSGGRWLEVAKAVIHKGYDLGTVDNDIALLRIDGELISEPIAFATLQDEADLLAPGITARVTGWGRTEFAEFGVDRLRFAEVNIFARETCNAPDAYNGAVTTNMICAGRKFDEAQNVDSCSGDSGGPLTVLSGRSRLQVGIVSWGGKDGDDGVAPCGQPDLVGVYTRFANYSDAVIACLGNGLQSNGLCGESFIAHSVP